MFLKLANEEPSGIMGNEHFINLENVFDIHYHYYDGHYFDNGDDAYQMFIFLTSNRTLEFTISEKTLFKTLKKLKKYHKS